MSDTRRGGVRAVRLTYGVGLLLGSILGYRYGGNGLGVRTAKIQVTESGNSHTSQNSTQQRDACHLRGISMLWPLGVTASLKLWLTCRWCEGQRGGAQRARGIRARHWTARCRRRPPRRRCLYPTPAVIQQHWEDGGGGHKNANLDA